MTGRHPLVPGAIALLFTGCGATPAPSLRVEVVQGTPPDPVLSPTALQVFVVTSHECPIANAYAPVLSELARGWQQSPVQIVLVHVDPDLDAEAAARHARDYELPGTVLLDPYHDLIRRLGATKTPEAIVRHRGEVVYRGRIDDQWHGLGARSQAASSFDLRDAVAAALQGRPIAPSQTEVIGCLLPEPR